MLHLLGQHRRRVVAVNVRQRREDRDQGDSRPSQAQAQARGRMGHLTGGVLAGYGLGAAPVHPRDWCEPDLGLSWYGA